MLMVSRKVYLLFSGLLITSAVIAAGNGHPKGLWMLEKIDSEIPFAGLRLNKNDRFELLVYDNMYQLYAIEDPIKQKSDSSWELKNNADYSNTFLMTMDRNKLRLVNTDDQKMFFFKTTQNKLKNAIEQKSYKPSNKKVNE
ncbi:hypothetical protein ACH42_02725 [Endozoicomonas sp. (ex Bugula neritina AB1)]|nr:hypothetical protein ACH42_02725 [Endozoicomonas sp. (ex Bugula neritina AB1)]